MKNSLSEKWSIGKLVIRKFCMPMLLSEIRPSEIRPSEKRPSEKSRGAVEVLDLFFFKCNLIEVLDLFFFKCNLFLFSKPMLLNRFQTPSCCIFRVHTVIGFLTWRGLTISLSSPDQETEVSHFGGLQTTWSRKWQHQVEKNRNSSTYF